MKPGACGVYACKLIQTVEGGSLSDARRPAISLQKLRRRISERYPSQGEGGALLPVSSPEIRLRCDQNCDESSRRGPDLRPVSHHGRVLHPGLSLHRGGFRSWDGHSFLHRHRQVRITESRTPAERFLTEELLPPLQRTRRKAEPDEDDGGDGGLPRGGLLFFPRAQLPLSLHLEGDAPSLLGESRFLVS